MFYTLNRFLRHLHLKSLPESNDTITILPIFTKFVVTTLVLLATNNLATFFVKHQLDALLLAFLAFLLIRQTRHRQYRRSGRSPVSWRRVHPTRRHPWRVHHLPASSTIFPFSSFFASADPQQPALPPLHWSGLSNSDWRLRLKCSFGNRFSRQVPLRALQEPVPGT